MFQIISVDPGRAFHLEQLGTKRKYWYYDEHARLLLFKAEERGTGDDWAEKICCELAEVLGLPHVVYDLAEEKGTCTPGVVCETFVPPEGALVLGNELLLRRDPSYPASDRYKVRSYTVDAVVEVVRSLELPLKEFLTNLPEEVETALDVFVGYILFDAWVANQDRHHENWGAVVLGRQMHLAPTFDHAASLARNLTDKERAERLQTRDKNRMISTFVRKARSAFYASVQERKPLTTMAAWRAFSSYAPQAAQAWLRRLASIDPATVKEIVARIPSSRMSGVAVDFTVKLLEENRRRLIFGENP